MPTEIHNPINCWCGSDHADCAASMGAGADGLRAALTNLREVAINAGAVKRNGEYDLLLQQALSAEKGCENHDPNTGPGSDYCPNCGQYEPPATALDVERLARAIYGKRWHEPHLYHSAEKYAAAYATPDASDD